MTHPKTHSLSEMPGRSVDEYFAHDIERPLIIVGNGPSASLPRHDLLADDPVVFRMNWFFLEDRYYFGRRVDGFFYTIANHLLEHNIAAMVRANIYDIGAVFAPMRPPGGRVDEGYASNLFTAGLPEFDHWDVVARNPVLSRFMMGRPLPTQGVQALAAALGIGFRDITLCGIDMYESTSARYGYSVPDDVRQALLAKDLVPGYENSHSLDRDLDFLDACLAQYPEASIRQIGPSVALAARLPAPPQRPRVNTFGGVSATDTIAAPKRGLEFTADEMGFSEPRALPSSDIGVRRCGYVTYVSGPFHHGARALARSLAHVSDVPLLVMCGPNADRVALRASGLNCVDVPDIFNPNELDRRNGRFSATYGKLNAFRMTHLDRAVYLDSDMIVLRSIDDLFDGVGFQAVCDHGLDHVYDRFNSGMFAFEPSGAVFDDMVERIRSTSSYDGGDQGFLNEYFSEWQSLAHEYNVNKRWSAHHPSLFHEDAVRVLHYTGIKPWQVEGPSAYDALYRLWFEQLSPEELIEVAESLRSIAAQSTAPRPRSTGTMHLVRSFLRPNRGQKATAIGVGSTFRRADALRVRGKYDEAVEELASSWPGADRASADHYRRLGTAQVLAGDLQVGTKTLREGARRFPDHATLLASLQKVENLQLVRRVTFGLAPTPWLTAIARRASR